MNEKTGVVLVLTKYTSYTERSLYFFFRIFTEGKENRNSFIVFQPKVIHVLARKNKMSEIKYISVHIICI